MRPSLLLALLLGASSAACVERRFAGPPPPDSAAPPAAETEVAVTPPPDDAGAPGLTWIDAVRLERWSEAATLLDALPDAAKARPEMRYVRARAAIGVGDGARALTLLEGLPEALPVVAPDLERWKAEAQLLAGPFAVAAAYFARSHTTRDLIRAAGAYQRAGDGAAARATIDRAVLAGSHGKGSHDEVLARMKRADIVGDTASEPDLRWGRAARRLHT